MTLEEIIRYRIRFLRERYCDLSRSREEQGQSHAAKAQLEAVLAEAGLPEEKP